jgi:glutathione synthase/RimK-type ligase-like ATP-grasp enzyme
MPARDFMWDVLLLTEGQYVKRLPEADYGMPPWYIDQIFEEDRLVTAALEALGLRVGRADWSDASVDWRLTRAALFRTTWDYFRRFEEFKSWLHRAAEQTQLINPATVIAWNFDKFYLRDLITAGVEVAPTLFLECGDKRSLADLFGETGWNEAVIKPAVSGGARDTYRIIAASSSGLEAQYARLIANERMLFQKFLPAISGDGPGRGEVSVMAMGGKVTHAIRKVAAPGDFRVQDDHGGRVLPHQASAEEVSFAQRVITACPHAAQRPLYHRIDMVRGPQGELTLCELEMIEPELWLRNCPSAAGELAAAIASTMS